jgi:dephospho-CoA kinase
MNGIKPQIIGLVGRPGSGKSTVSEYLVVTQNYQHILLSDFLKEAITRDGIEHIDRKLLQQYGNQLRETYGAGILAQKAIEKISQNGWSCVVIDGIRNVSEIEVLRKIDAFLLIGIEAPVKTRFDRLVTRKIRPIEDDYDAFANDEKGEDSLGNGTTGLRVSDCLKHVDVLIKNDGTVNDLYQAVNAALGKEN